MIIRPQPVRPQPPRQVLEPLPVTVPDLELADWIYKQFIDNGATWQNEDHEHLQEAYVACAWTNVDQNRQMNMVAGMAEIPTIQGNVWQKARHDQQIIEWFGRKPDFLLTFFAPYVVDAEDAAFCALLDHELYHCAQKKDAFGAPKFRDDGTPCFGIRGHDVEEFVGVARRWGVDACAGKSRAFVQAANAEPTIARANISLMCGNCLK